MCVHECSGRRGRDLFVCLVSFCLWVWLDSQFDLTADLYIIESGFCACHLHAYLCRYYYIIIHIFCVCLLVWSAAIMPSGVEVFMHYIIINKNSFIHLNSLIMSLQLKHWKNKVCHLVWSDTAQLCDSFGKYSLKISTLTVTFDHEDSSQKQPQDTLTCDYATLYTMFGCKRLKGYGTNGSFL